MNKSNIAKNLRVLRLQSDKKQDEIAAYLGISQQEYSKFERNSAIPNVKHLEQLSKLYNVTIDFLINNTNQASGNNQTLTTKERELYEMVIESKNAQIKILEAIKLPKDQR
jgi:transcriptional regulator with XRE-family HTH domain